MQHLYLMERTAGKSLWASITLQCEVKIGISNNPEVRLQSVQKSTSGKVELLLSRPYRNAYRVEQKIHRMFADSNFRMQSTRKGTNGETEWFYMSWLEMLFLIGWLRYYKHKYIFISAFFCAVLIIYYNQQT